MKIIGITGGIGSGKSEVLNFMKSEYSAFVLEADKVAYDLEEPGMLCYKKIISEFGTGILKKDMTIERPKLAEIVFSDKTRLKRLNEIVHPEVKRYIVDTIKKIRNCNEVDYCIIEAALFFEEKYEILCDEVWYIYVSEKNRVERLLKSRGYPERKIRQIMNTQLSEQKFRQNCSVVIDNNGDIEQTYKQIREELKCQNR